MHMKELTKIEMQSINGGSELSRLLITLVSYMFYSEGKTVADSTVNGGNAAAVLPFK